MALEECRQQHGQSLAEFFELFKTHVEVYEHFGGSLGKDQGLIDELKDKDDFNHPGAMLTMNRDNPKC